MKKSTLILIVNLLTMLTTFYFLTKKIVIDKYKTIVINHSTASKSGLLELKNGL